MSTYNPVTYVLEAMHSLLTDGWDPAPIARAVAAILLVAAVSLPLAMAMFRRRTGSGT